MDRTYWLEEVSFLPGEKVVVQQAVVRLYDGEEKVSFNFYVPDYMLTWSPLSTD